MSTSRPKTLVTCIALLPVLMVSCGELWGRSGTKGRVTVLSRLVLCERRGTGGAVAAIFTNTGRSSRLYVVIMDVQRIERVSAEEAAVFDAGVWFRGVNRSHF